MVYVARSKQGRKIGVGKAKQGGLREVENLRMTAIDSRQLEADARRRALPPLFASYKRCRIYQDKLHDRERQRNPKPRVEGRTIAQARRVVPRRTGFCKVLKTPPLQVWC